MVSEDCKTMVVKGTNILAGSCSSMLDIFYNLVRIMNVPIAEAVKMLSENPARYECKKYARMETIVCIVYIAISITVKVAIILLQTCMGSL